jgi:lysophospholipase L1-like esterase
MLGDSYVTGTGGQSPALQPAMVSLMSNASGFRNYAVAGAALATGGIAGLIFPQFDQAVAANANIKLAIMDGGLSDILACDASTYPACTTICNSAGSSTASVCTTIVTEARKAFTNLLTKMANAGVSDVIYFFLPHLPGSNSGYAELVDYAAPLFASDCAGTLATSGGKLACHFVDLRAPFAAAGGDMNPANFTADAVHPSPAGQAIIATEIVGVMTSQCLGRTSSSGCCR